MHQTTTTTTKKVEGRLLMRRKGPGEGVEEEQGEFQKKEVTCVYENVIVNAMALCGNIKN